MRTKKIFFYLTAFVMASFGVVTLADSAQMQCPEVRDYGGFPHTTGKFLEYKLDHGRGMLLRRYGDSWTVVCDEVSKCTFNNDMVSVSEIRIDQKKISFLSSVHDSFPFSFNVLYKYVYIHYDWIKS